MSDHSKIPKTEHDCGAAFITTLQTLSPAWRDKIQALMEERHLTPTQALGSLAAFALDTGQYLIVPDHPFFHDQTLRPAGTHQLCPVCEKEWELLYPGQPVCSNACAAAFYVGKQS